MFPVVATFGTAPDAGTVAPSWLLRLGLPLAVAAADAVVVGNAVYYLLRVARRVPPPLSDNPRVDGDRGAASALHAVSASPQRRPRGYYFALLRAALSVPLEAVWVALLWSRGGFDAAAAATLAPYLHALRAPRCLFVLALSARFQALEDAVGEYARLRMVRMVTYLFLVQHLITCAWFGLGERAAQCPDRCAGWPSRPRPPYLPSFPAAGHLQGFGTSPFVPSEALWRSSAGDQYLHALHWAVHGKGDATPHGAVQILFHAFALVVQELGLASIVGQVRRRRGGQGWTPAGAAADPYSPPPPVQVASLIANEDGAAARFRERLRRVDEHMAAVQVPHTLRLRVREFYLFLWVRVPRGAG